MIGSTRHTLVTLPIRRTRSTPRGRNRREDPCTPLVPTGINSLGDLSPCWWAAAELRPWWVREVADMGVAYPSFRPLVRRRHRELWSVVASRSPGRHHVLVEPESDRERVERDQCGEFVLAWRGSITPFPSGMSFEEVQAIVADLDEDVPVRVLADGALAHYDECGGKHSPRPGLQLGQVPEGTFQIEIAHRRPPGCPIARSRWPRINRDHRRGPPPHLLNAIEALCILFPADGAWVWGVHGIRHYANYTVIWLAKHLVWVEARQRGISVDEAWPGSVVGHDPAQLRGVLGQRDPCRCGSGKVYGDCCWPGDALALDFETWRKGGQP